MTICFCGHSNLYGNYDEVKQKCLCVVKEQLNMGADKFLIGNYGEFDFLAAAVCLALKAEYLHIEVDLVIPYYRPNIDIYTQDKYNRFDNVIVPPLEEIPHRYRIVKANRYMVDQADAVIAYVWNKSGGAAKTLSYASKRRKIIYNLVNEFDIIR